jgi:hypothetical protein
MLESVPIVKVDNGALYIFRVPGLLGTKKRHESEEMEYLIDVTEQEGKWEG